MILEQIKKDIKSLEQTLSSLWIRRRNEASGQAESAVKVTRQIRKKTDELRKLENIILSGIIPNEYYSKVTKQFYRPSDEERSRQRECLPPAQHGYFSTKQSRKKTGALNSKFDILTENVEQALHFSLQHDPNKRYPKGAFSERVKKGYLEGTFEPKYAVKIYRKGAFKNSPTAQPFCDYVLQRSLLASLIRGKGCTGRKE